ncbi:hypothetical protein, partial [Longimicrobium sp.]|uniref:hypothetical protein n=1 Tax=Longimicrobium sp. TaxID=2029185 RepID=UPI002F93B851
MRQQRSSLLRVTAALSLVLAGCTDSTAPPDPVRATESASRDVSQLRDAAINPGDTHFSAKLSTRTYVEDPEQMAAPVGVASTSDVSSQVYQDYGERYVEGGYRADGQVVFGVYWDDAVQSPEIGSVRASADHVITYDRWGSVLSSEYFDSYMADTGLPGGTLVDGFFDDGSGGDCDPTAVICDPTQPASTSGPTVTAAENGEWREIRTVFSPAASGDFTAARSGAGKIETVRRYRRMAAAPGQSTGTPGWRLEQIRQTV